MVGFFGSLLRRSRWSCFGQVSKSARELQKALLNAEDEILISAKKTVIDDGLYRILGFIPSNHTSIVVSSAHSEDIWGAKCYKFGTDYNVLHKALSNGKYCVRVAAAEAVSENTDTPQDILSGENIDNVSLGGQGDLHVVMIISRVPIIEISLNKKASEDERNDLVREGAVILTEVLAKHLSKVQKFFNVFKTWFEPVQRAFSTWISPLMKSKQNSSSGSGNNPPSITYFKLALQLYAHSHKKAKYKFTVHGLWPQTANHQSCPAIWSYSQPAMRGALKGGLTRVLKKIWPSKAPEDPFLFWYREYNNHGAHFHPVIYFTTAVNLFIKLSMSDKIHIRDLYLGLYADELVPGGDMMASQLQSIAEMHIYRTFGKYASPEIICLYDPFLLATKKEAQLHEIRVLFDLSFEPISGALVNCDADTIITF